jgi:hypothetical protein
MSSPQMTTIFGLYCCCAWAGRSPSVVKIETTKPGKNFLRIELLMSLSPLLDVSKREARNDFIAGTEVQNVNPSVPRMPDFNRRSLVLAGEREMQSCR